MILKTLALSVLLFGTAACVTIPSIKPDGVDVVLGQTAYVDGPKIRPIKVIEDSRCPMNARCIWAGRVRILAVWAKPSGDEEIELTLGEPLPLADGSLTLIDVKPSRMAGEGKAIKPGDYRFSFQFVGGL
jgi:hypothetical protein